MGCHLVKAEMASRNLIGNFEFKMTDLFPKPNFEKVEKFLIFD